MPLFFNLKTLAMKKFLTSLILYVCLMSILQAQDFDYQSIRDFAVSPLSPMKMLIDEKLAENGQMDIEFYSSGLAPEGILLQQILLPNIQNNSESINFTLHFFGDIDSDGNIISPNGELEVEEELRQIAIANQAPNKLLDYMLYRGESFYQNSGSDALQALGFGTKINTFIDTQAKGLLLNNITDGQSTITDQGTSVLIIDGEVVENVEQFFDIFVPPNCPNYFRCLEICMEVNTIGLIWGLTYTCPSVFAAPSWPAFISCLISAGGAIAEYTEYIECRLKCWGKQYAYPQYSLGDDTTLIYDIHDCNSPFKFCMSGTYRDNLYDVTDQPPNVPTMLPEEITTSACVDCFDDDDVVISPKNIRVISPKLKTYQPIGFFTMIDFPDVRYNVNYYVNGEHKNGLTAEDYLFAPLSGQVNTYPYINFESNINNLGLDYYYGHRISGLDLNSINMDDKVDVIVAPSLGAVNQDCLPSLVMQNYLFECPEITVNSDYYSNTISIEANFNYTDDYDSPFDIYVTAYQDLLFSTPAKFILTEENPEKALSFLPNGGTYQISYKAIPKGMLLIDVDLYTYASVFNECAGSIAWSPNNICYSPQNQFKLFHSYTDYNINTPGTGSIFMYVKNFGSSFDFELKRIGVNTPIASGNNVPPNGSDNDYSNTFSDLVPGTYTISIEYTWEYLGQEYNCNWLEEIEISDACTNFVACQNPISLDYSVVNASSGNQSDGQINFTNQGLTYVWDDLQSATNDAYRHNLLPGEYCVDVYNSECCYDHACIVVGPNCSAFNIYYDVIAPCSGQNNGQISINPSGGFEPYTYLWNNGSTSNELNNLPAGEYSVTVEDGQGCIKDKTITILEADDLYSIDYDHNTNSAEIQSFNNPLIITWNGPGITDENISNLSLSNLPSGDYCVNIQSLNGCSSTECITFYDAMEFSLLNCADNEVSFESCLTITGGSGNYSILWPNGDDTYCSGQKYGFEFCVTVIDNASSQTIVECFTIEYPGELSIEPSTLQAPCPDSSNGKACVNVQGGNPPYQYLWSTGSNTNCSGAFLQEGETASVTVTDDCGNQTIGNYTIPEYTFPFASSSTNEAACENSTNGSITIIPTGGYPRYEYYEWFGGTLEHNVITDKPTLSNVGAGIYCVQITDQCGQSPWVNCYTVEEYQNDNPIGNISFDIDGDCANSPSPDGSIIMSIPDQDSYVLDFEWNTGANIQNLEQITAGDYTVTVTQRNGCETHELVSVPSASNILGLWDLGHPNCSNADATGFIQVFVTPYSNSTYNWNNGETTSEISGLVSGNYTVSATTDDGCNLTRTIKLEGQNDIENITAVITPDHPSTWKNSGSIDITSIDPSNPPYSYSWSNGATTQDINFLSNGLYIVTVVNGSGCSTIKTFIVDSCFPEPTISLESLIPISENISGSISVNVTGLNAPLSFSWIGPNGFSRDTKDINGLFEPGNYCLTVTDDCDRTNEKCFYVTDNCLINASLYGIDPCDDSDGWGGVDGYIQAYPNSDDYFYEWENSDGPLGSGYGLSDWDPQTNNSTYCVTITGPNHCTSSVCGTWASDSKYKVNGPWHVSPPSGLESYDDRIYVGCNQYEYCGSFNNGLDEQTDFVFYPFFGSNSPCMFGGALYCEEDDSFFAFVPPINGSPLNLNGNCGCVFPPGIIPGLPDYWTYAEYECPSDDNNSGGGGSSSIECSPACEDYEFCKDGECILMDCPPCAPNEFCAGIECKPCPTNFTIESCWADEDCGNPSDCHMEVTYSSQPFGVFDIEFYLDGILVHTLERIFIGTGYTQHYQIPCGETDYEIVVSHADCGLITTEGQFVECSVNCFTGNDENPQTRTIKDTVQDEIAPDFSIYPNPFLEDVFITGNNPGNSLNTKVQVTNSLGELIITKNILFESGESTFNLTELKSIPDGVYILTIRNDKRVLKNHKLIKISN